MQNKTRKPSLHKRSRRLLPTPPDSDISSPSPPTSGTWQRSPANENKEKKKQKPKFQSFISRSKIDQILKSGDPTQTAREAWIRRKSYNPTAVLKTKRTSSSKEDMKETRTTALKDHSKPRPSQPKQLNRTKSFLDRPVSMGRLVSNNQRKQDMQEMKEMMVSSLIESKPKNYGELMRPLHYGSGGEISEHSSLDQLVISSMGSFTTKLCRAMAAVLHRAVLMLNQDQQEMVSSLYTVLVLLDTMQLQGTIHRAGTHELAGTLSGLRKIEQSLSILNTLL